MAKAIIYADSASPLDPNLSTIRLWNVPPGARLTLSDSVVAAG